MDVIPLTLVISLLLSLTFIALFALEFSRPRRAGAERDSLLPLHDDARAATSTPYPPDNDTLAATRTGTTPHAHNQAHNHPDDELCASRRTDGKCCASCRRRRERTAAHTAAASDAPTSTLPPQT